MKRILLFLMIGLVSVCFAACGNDTANKSSENVNSSEKRILVAYFSRADENTGGVGYIEKGNTRILAEMLAEMTKADLFEIKPTKPYPKEYIPATEVAKQEKEENARPEIVGELPDIQKYDVILLGYPIWWSDLPMAVYTFLERENFSGKVIAPFCTHEGSGIGSTEQYIEKATQAKVLNGLEMRGSMAQNAPQEAKEELAKWLDAIGLK